MEDLNAALHRSPIGHALARLSPQHRAVIWRSYYLGWTTARIADDLHIADETVKSRLHHAMRALRLIQQEIGVTGLDRNPTGISKAARAAQHPDGIADAWERRTEHIAARTVRQPRLSRENGHGFAR